LSQGLFYCGVQAIDGAFVGSPFSSEITFTTNGSGINSSISSKDDFRIYPNPSGRLLNIILPPASILDVYSVQGALITNFNNNSAFPLNKTMELKDGIYFFKTMYKEKISLLKLIVIDK